MFKKGDLVRVRETAMHNDAPYSHYNKGLVAKYGWLYLVETESPRKKGVYRCKSLATGGIRTTSNEPITWHYYEIEKANV